MEEDDMAIIFEIDESTGGGGGGKLSSSKHIHSGPPCPPQKNKEQGNDIENKIK